MAPLDGACLLKTGWIVYSRRSANNAHRTVSNRCRRPGSFWNSILNSGWCVWILNSRILAKCVEPPFCCPAMTATSSESVDAISSKRQCCFSARIRTQIPQTQFQIKLFPHRTTSHDLRKKRERVPRDFVRSRALSFRIPGNVLQWLWCFGLN